MVSLVITITWHGSDVSMHIHAIAYLYIAYCNVYDNRTSSSLYIDLFALCLLTFYPLLLLHSLNRILQVIQ